MFRIAVSLATAVLLLAHECHAQFLDTFDGDALGPHWTIGTTPASLQHSVGGGLLTVTDLPLPSIAHSPQNNAVMVAAFAPVSGDFIARAGMGWDDGSDRIINWNLTTETGSRIAEVSYSEGFPGGPGLRVSGGVGQSQTFPAPPPGMHEFALSRQGSTLSAYWGGELLVSFPSLSSAPVSRVGLNFSVAYPNDGFDQVYVDLVEIIPAPPSSAALVLCAAVCCRRRRS